MSDWGGNGQHCCGGIVGGDVGFVEIKLALRGGRAEVPEADGVVVRAREELVGRRVEGDAGHGSGVAAEIAYV